MILCFNTRAVRPEGTRSTLAARLWRRVDTDGECWLWTGAVTSSGYGRLRYHYRYLTPHVVAWELEHGPLPAGMRLYHRCRDRACVRPDHLFVAPRVPTGIPGFRPHEIASIRREHAVSGTPLRVLAARWGVSPATIWRVVAR